MEPALDARQSGGGQVERIDAGPWRMRIPPGPAGAYRWAQLDDYLHLPRGAFAWQSPARLELRARVSSNGLPGTWGFGLWNDPFNAGLGLNGMARRLPTLPNAAWFFYAGPPNHLAFRDSHPAGGFLAATFSSPLVPPLLLAPAALALPLLALPPAARLLRKAAGALIGEDAVLIESDPTVWRTYRVELRGGRARFWVDEQQVLSTPFAPRGRLGLVIWIDNQYAAFPPSGRLRSGMSESPVEAWLEVDRIDLQADAV